MTFTDFKSFQEWVMDYEQIDVLEINPPQDNNKFISIQNINDTSGQYIAELLITAYDSGFFLGYFSVEKYNGCLTIYE